MSGMGRGKIGAGRGAVTGLALVAVAAACGGGAGGEAGEAGEAVRRDSAGVEIVELASPRGSSGWAVDPEPAVDIGRLDGPEAYQLYRATSAVRLSDGRIVVANGGTGELRFYDRAGRHLQSVGREGSGPGEFEDLQRVWRLPGDSLLAYDFFPARLSVFSPAGEYVRTVRIGSPDGRQVIVRGPFDDGSLLVAGAPIWGAAGAAPGVVRDTVPYYRFGVDGALLDTLGWFPSAEAYRFATDQGWRLTGLPFPRSPVAAVSGHRFHFGPADRYEIRTFEAAGGLTRVLRLDVPNRTVSAEDVQRYRDDRLERATDRAAMERVLREVPVPREMPAYARLEAGPEGELWVADYPGGDDATGPASWRVFRPDGSDAGQVLLPAGFELLQVGTDHVLGRWLDPMDVEHIRLHRLDRSGP